MADFKNLDITAYKVELEKLSNDDGGGYLATVPKLPGCMSDGETQEEALENVQDAIKAWIETALELGRPIPMPEEHKPEDEFSGKLSLRLPKSLHKMLSEQSIKEGCSINQLIVTYIALGLGNEFGKNKLYFNFDINQSTIENLMLKQWDDGLQNSGDMMALDLINVKSN